MKLSNNLLADVRRLANEKKKSITSEELLASPAFARYAQNLIDGIVKRYDSRVTLHLISQGPDGITACTDGNHILMNVTNGIVTTYDAMFSQFMCALGMLFHEMAHILYCDFSGDKKARDTVKTGRFYGLEPMPLTQEEADNLEELKDALANPVFAPVFEQLYSDYANILDDVHDEAKMKAHYGALISQGLTVTADALRMGADSLEDMEAAKLEPLVIMENLVLQMARFGEFLTTDPDSLTSSEYTKRLFCFARDIEAAKSTDDTKERYGYINHMILCLWPYIRDALAEMQSQPQQQDPSQQDDSNGGSAGDSASSAGNGSDGNSTGSAGDPSQGGGTPQSGGTPQQQGNDQQQGGGNGGKNKQPPTQEQIQAILNALKQAAQNSGTTPQPKGTGKPLADTKPESKGGGVSNGNDKAGEEAMQDAMTMVLNSLAESLAESDVDEALAQAERQRIKLVDQGSSHEGIPLDVNRVTDVSPEDVARYEAELDEVKAYSKRLQRQMREALRDLKDGYIQHHKLTGNRLEARNTYRPDQRYFASRKLPQDLPDMAVSVLVDCSGSMGGSRINAARKAAILLHDFCLGLNIPVHVAGHDTRGSTVEYAVYTDFTAVGKKDRYRLEQMCAGGCNRDGMAIEIAGNLLASRPEEVKLLIVISDGLPNHTGYKGEPAKEDIRNIVKKYRRKGVETIAAAIGSDRADIKDIYGDGFLDIEDLDKLPRTLTALVKKRIVP